MLTQSLHRKLDNYCVCVYVRERIVCVCCICLSVFCMCTCVCDYECECICMCKYVCECLGVSVGIGGVACVAGSECQVTQVAKRARLGARRPCLLAKALGPVCDT